MREGGRGGMGGRRERREGGSEGREVSASPVYIRICVPKLIGCSQTVVSKKGVQTKGHCSFI